MRIPDERIHEYKRLHQEKFNEDISMSDASARLSGLVWLYGSVSAYVQKTKKLDQTEAAADGSR